MKAARTTLLLLLSAVAALEARARVHRVEAPEVTVRRAIEALRSDDAERRLGAIEGLAGLGEPAREAVPVLVELLGHDPSPRVRAAIAGELESLGTIPPSTRRALRAAVGDPAPAVPAKTRPARPSCGSPAADRRWFGSPQPSLSGPSCRRWPPASWTGASWPRPPGGHRQAGGDGPPAHGPTAVGAGPRVRGASPGLDRPGRRRADVGRPADRRAGSLWS